MTDKEKAHQIAWGDTKHYDPNCCKQEWVEMGAIDMAKWKERQMIEKAVVCFCCFAHKKSDIEHFKKAMEELI